MTFNPRKATFVFMIFCMAAVAWAQNPFESVRQFSATVVMSGEGIKAAQGMAGMGGDMKVYRSGDGDGLGHVHADDPAAAESVCASRGRQY